MRAVAQELRRIARNTHIALATGSTRRMLRSLEILRDEMDGEDISYSISASLDQVPQIVFDLYEMRLRRESSSEFAPLRDTIEASPAIRQNDARWDRFLRGALRAWSAGELEVGDQTLSSYQLRITSYFDTAVRYGIEKNISIALLSPAGVIETLFRRILSISSTVPFGSLNVNFFHAGISKCSTSSVDSATFLDSFNDISHLARAGAAVTFR